MSNAVVGIQEAVDEELAQAPMLRGLETLVEGPTVGSNGARDDVCEHGPENAHCQRKLANKGNMRQVTCVFGTKANDQHISSLTSGPASWPCLLTGKNLPLSSNLVNLLARSRQCLTLVM